ncbi:MFS transporter [Nonomuraea sp. NPDC049309]|uniref:MFS transporter n=1 Tax=Nonomuraea sp. NPDC049309 TaxID=3364350 RepID=UPI003717DFB7
MPEHVRQTGQAPAAETAGDRHLGFTLAAIVTCQLMIGLDITVVNVALPEIRLALGMSAIAQSWVVSAYTLAFGGLLLLGGRISDALGRREVFIGGVALFTVASLAGGLATAPGVLLAARAVQGVGAALAAPNMMALIAANFAEGAPRTRALAVYSSVSGLSLSAGLILGGLLTSLASWRWVMFVNVPVGVVIVALALRYVRPVPKHRTGLDVAGAVLGTAGMTAMVYGLVRTGEAGWGDRTAPAALAAALAALALFLLAEARAAHPLLPLGLFRDRNRAAAYLNMLLIAATMLGMFFFLTQYLQTVKGFTPLATGIAFLPLALTALVTARAVPWLLLRLGPKAVTASGTVAIAAGLLWLTRLSATSGYATGVLGPLILVGIGIGVTFVPLNSFILAGLRPHQTGAAAATVQTMQQAGSSLGLAVLVTVFGAAARDAAPGSPAGLAGVIATSFGAASAFAVCALAVAIVVVRRPAQSS